jgi:hypothetical protein
MELEIESKLQLIGYDYRENLVYILFRANEHESSDLHLFTIHRQTQALKQYVIKQELTFKITHLSVLEQSVVLGGYVSNEPAILIYDLNTENLKIVPGFFVSQTELLDLRANVNNTFNTLIIDRAIRDKKKLILKTFDATGALLLEDILPIDEKRTILAAITSTLVNDEILITGTWTMGVSKMASGVFSTLADPFSDQKINYYDFGQLNRFFDYQSKKKAVSLKEKSKKASAAGTVPDFKAYATVIRLEEKPEGFALLTEVYQPSSNFSSSPYYAGAYPYSGYGSYYPYYGGFNRRFYNYPYQYNSGATEAGDARMLYSSVILFNRKGEIENDYGIVLEDKKNDVVEQTSDFVYDSNEIAIAYKKEKQMFINGVSDTGIVVSDTLSTYRQEEAEIVRSDSENSFIRYWYEHFMYSWGYMRIKDSSNQTDDPHRYVFYINKISID